MFKEYDSIKYEVKSSFQSKNTKQNLVLLISRGT